MESGKAVQVPVPGHATQASRKAYHRLVVWQEAHKLVLAVYRTTESFPRSELFGLTSQMRRSAASVATNIVEGQGRGTDAEWHAI
jgi:23S rRNA-intervening sequence protein